MCPAVESAISVLLGCSIWVEPVTAPSFAIVEWRSVEPGPIGWHRFRPLAESEIECVQSRFPHPSSSREDVSFWLGPQTADRNHSRIGDLMDTITETRDV